MPAAHVHIQDTTTEPMNKSRQFVYSQTDRSVPTSHITWRREAHDALLVEPCLVEAYGNSC